jgi:hypothetical protein
MSPSAKKPTAKKAGAKASAPERRNADPLATAPMAASDYDPAEPRRWEAALQAWMVGRPDLLAKLILDESFCIPDNMRHFLSDLVLGKVKKRGGRPPEYTGQAVRQLFEEVMEAWDAQGDTSGDRSNTGARDAAIEHVSALHGMEGDALRGVIDRLRADGMTREFWSRHMRRRR